MWHPKFLEAIAKQLDFTDEERAVFLAKLSSRYRDDYEIAEGLNITEPAVRYRMGRIYKKFHIGGKGPGKYSQLLELLTREFEKFKANGVSVTDTLQEKNSIERKGVLAQQHQDWGDVDGASAFYGRDRELEELRKWILTDRCRLVGLLGIGGIGKTSLAVRLAQQIQDEFEYLILRS
ncbi:MAG TPA: hypothetical protein V6C85_12885, partial [Allocoleopsis sp.]